VIRRIVLLASGAVALAVGGASLFAPVAFRGQYNIDIGDDVNLLSETRAAGGAVLAVGLLLVAGAFVGRLAFAAALAGAVCYLAYAASRAVSAVLDGAPTGGLVAGGVVELALGLACAYLVARSDGAAAGQSRSTSTGAV
jgi:hypothetical protein